MKVYKNLLKSKSSIEVEIPLGLELPLNVQLYSDIDKEDCIITIDAIFNSSNDIWIQFDNIRGKYNSTRNTIDFYNGSIDFDSVVNNTKIFVINNIDTLLFIEEFEMLLIDSINYTNMYRGIDSNINTIDISSYL